MRNAMSILLGAVVISAVCFAAEYPGPKGEPAAATETVAAVGAPTALRLSIDRDCFLLDWRLSPQDPGPVTGYEIVRADVFSGPYETVGRVNKGISGFVDRSAKPEIIYFYKVRAQAGDLHSPFSKEATGELPGKP